MKLINRGKVKDVYETDRNTLVFAFSDRISAYDVVLNDSIPFKGKILCDFAVYWFDKLDIQNHFIKRISANMIEVKKLNIIPLEFVVRQYLYGSLYKRYIKNETKNTHYSQYFENKNLKLASRLPELIFDPTTKSTLHDEPITLISIVEKNILSQSELDGLEDESLNLFRKISSTVSDAGFLLSDIKFEYGRDLNNNVIYLADSIGPDEFRIWDKDDYEVGKSQKSYDKQLLRDWLSDAGFLKDIEESRIKHANIKIPTLPLDLISKLTQTYINVYERITGLTFEERF